MNEIDKTILTDQTKFRLNEISQIENYFNSEISQRKTCEKLSKSVTAFDYIDEILIVLSATTGGVCIVSHATVVGAWIYYCIFFGNRNNKKIIKHNKKQKEKA